MGAIALDASVVIGVLDSADAHHAQAAELLRGVSGEDRLSMSSVAYAEALIGPVRKGDLEVVDRFVERGRVEIIPMDRAIARAAAELRARHGALRLSDAVVLACARARDARLLTFDTKLRRIAAR